MTVYARGVGTMVAIGLLVGAAYAAGAELAGSVSIQAAVLGYVAMVVALLLGVALAAQAIWLFEENETLRDDLREAANTVPNAMRLP